LGDGGVVQVRERVSYYQLCVNHVIKVLFILLKFLLTLVDAASET
jgi:hypothetical protein